MLFFRSEDEIAQWTASSGEPRGEYLTLAQTWRLSQLWYHDRLREDFRGRSLDDVVGIFETLGLRSAFWRP